MTKPTPRRPSRTTTPKPRKIAGRDAAPAEPLGDSPAGASPAGVSPAGRSQTTPGASSRTSSPPTQGPVKQAAASKAAPVASPPVAEAPSALSSLKVTRMLLVLLAALAVLLALQGVWFYLHDRENDDRADAAVSAPADGEDGPITVPSGRPVVLNQLAVQEGVEAAAAAAQIMFTRNWQSYDDGVDNAISLMTEDFAEDYRTTTDDVRREFVAKKSDVQVHVVAQSVVRANETELEALVFLNQYVFRGEGEQGKTTYTPYRAVLTMVHTDRGWLVDGLQTK